MYLHQTTSAVSTWPVVSEPTRGETPRGGRGGSRSTLRSPQGHAERLTTHQTPLVPPPPARKVSPTRAAPPSPAPAPGTASLNSSGARSAAAGGCGAESGGFLSAPRTMNFGSNLHPTLQVDGERVCKKPGATKTWSTALSSVSMQIRPGALRTQRELAKASRASHAPCPLRRRRQVLVRGPGRRQQRVHVRRRRR